MRLDVLNYLIVLQIMRFNRTKTREFYVKYQNLFACKKFKDMMFDIGSDEINIFNEYCIEFESKAENFLSSYNDGILFYTDSDYPLKLLEVDDFPPCLFFIGDLSLLKRKSISVVGTRNPSEKGIYNAERIGKFLALSNIVIVSGLAKGVDFITQSAASKYNKNNLISVIGTPLNKYYPIENQAFQDYIANNGLLISEMPYFESTKRWSFIRRNHVMSAISDATIVIEAKDTSGTVSQARSTLKNKRSLFVPNSVFEDEGNSWPRKFTFDYKRVYKFRDFYELINLMGKLYE